MERFKSLLFFCFLTVLLCGAGTGDIWAGTWTSGGPFSIHSNTYTPLDFITGGADAGTGV